MDSFKKGFTLIELLVVIAILAVLATVIVVIINPAELLRQARDATRVSDMAALNSAVALYLSDVATPGLGGASNAACSVLACKMTSATMTSSSPFSTTPACSSVTTTTPDGTGWVTVDFTKISSGSPLSRLPLDPANTGTYMYVYGCNGLGYKLATAMESTKYSNPNTGVMRNTYDGGTRADFYEVGNSLSL